MHGFELALYLAADAFGVATGPIGFGILVWTLAIVFVWSGIAKMRQPALAAMAMVDFGVIQRIRPRLGSALGVAESLLAVFLITGVLPALSLSVAAGLLWLFALLIAKNLWSGKRFACFCFGDADSKLSRLTLVRTTALAVLASVLTVALPTAGAYGSFSGTYLLQATTAAALIGTIVLSSRVPKLLRWNKDPYMIGKVDVIE